jgi:hypothetical protein
VVAGLLVCLFAVALRASEVPTSPVNTVFLPVSLTVLGNNYWRLLNLKKFAVNRREYREDPSVEVRQTRMPLLQLNQ